MNSNSQNLEVGRRNPATGVHIQLGRPNFVLLTDTTEDRMPWLINPVAHQFLHETWFAATAWLVGDYLLMPDHLHAFCTPRDLSFTLEQWITFWKRDFHRRHGRKEWKFQSRGWHHRLRVDEDYSAKWLYVQENPVRKGLAKQIEEWPFKGTIQQLAW
jgi:putative transposase